MTFVFNVKITLVATAVYFFLQDPVFVVYLTISIK